MNEPDIYPVDFNSESTNIWSDKQKADYLKTELNLVFECKGITVKYAKVQSIKGWKWELYNASGAFVVSGITYEDSAPIDYFKMIIYSKLGLDYYRRSPSLPCNKVINSKGEIKEVPPHTLYVFEE